MVVKKPIERKRLIPDPGARSSIAKAVSVALTILETTKQPSWRLLADAVFSEDPKVRSYLVALDIDPDTDALLAEHADVIELIRFGAGSVGRKPTTTTLLTCSNCSRWLISVTVSGTPTCVLTIGCTGRLVVTKKATKIAVVDPVMLAAAAPDDARETIDDPGKQADDGASEHQLPSSFHAD